MPPPLRRRIEVSGTVQGVGFRPFVYRQAVSLGLTGSVRNDRSGVVIEVEGDRDRIDELRRRLVDDPPPMARVDHVAATPLDTDPRPPGAGGFAIIDSTRAGAPATPIAPIAPVSVDAAVCDDCLAEMADPADRRYRYPFTNCTNCGPRYTIVEAVPYDRRSTTMAAFAMCADCQREFDDPADRRFHAQPNACPACGPEARFCAPSGAEVARGDNAVVAAVDALRRGEIVAVKGLGGYHLAVDATDATAVASLRRRKHRDDKPFAVMVAEVGAAHALVVLDRVAEQVLTSPRRPIVVAPHRDPAGNAGVVAPAVASGLPDLGVMLPYTPLHHLLLAGVGRPLVMTSGNVSDEPIAHEDDDAFARLGPLVDGVLTHDRRIHVRADDSVVRSSGGRSQVRRRSRGYAPQPLPLPLPLPGRRQVLAVGAELKSTVSVVTGDWVVTSHHLGDLEHPAAYASFCQAVEHLCRLFGVAPEVVVHDLHPEYLSTKWALDTDLPTLGVQHHHAHIASCLVDHGHEGPVLGVAFDGHGFGTDGTLWGGEFLVADLAGFRRVGHLASVPLAGGTAAVREPWRMAVAWLYAAAGADAARRAGERLDPRAGALVEVLAGGAGSSRTAFPTTTSAGRLFDAVAALLGVRTEVTYEGQAAVELEAVARTIPRRNAPVYPVDIRNEAGGAVLDPTPLILALIEARDAGTPGATIAAGFHEGLGRGAARLAADLASAHGLDTIALTGGVFQNPRLTEVVESALLDAGLRVLLHRDVPPNDGGISIGQAAIAAHASRTDA